MFFTFLVQNFMEILMGEAEEGGLGLDFEIFIMKGLEKWMTFCSFSLKKRRFSRKKRLF